MQVVEGNVLRLHLMGAYGLLDVPDSRTMVSPPVKLAIPFLFNLYTNPREDRDKQITDSWVSVPC